MELCNEIVQQARYGKREDGTLTITINGFFVFSAFPLIYIMEYYYAIKNYKYNLMFKV